MNFVNEIGEPRQTFLSGLAAAQILEQGGERLRVCRWLATPPVWPIRSGGGRRVRAFAHSGYGPLV